MTMVKDNPKLVDVIEEGFIMVNRLMVDPDSGEAERFQKPSDGSYIECLTQEVQGQPRQIFYLEDNLRQAM